MQIKVSNLCYTYGKGIIKSPTVLKDISFTINKQDIWGIIGPSGAGKTTLGQLIAGLIKPSSGKINMNCPFLPRIGMVFQNPENQFFEETLAKDARAGLVDRGWNEKTIKDNIEKAFQWVGLGQFLDRSPFSLSGGEKRLAAIACVLSSDPDIIIFDEPIASLDHPHRRKIYRLVKTLRRQGKTICVISHDLEWIVPLTNRLLILKGGKTLWSGKSEALFSYPKLITDAGLELPEIPFIMKKLAESAFMVNGTALKVRDAARIIGQSFEKNLSG